MKVFWSYAKRDDPKPFNLTGLKDQFQIVLGQCLGMDVDVFQDKSGLEWGAKWRDQLEKEVSSSDALVCILTPSYFSSKMCIQEFMWGKNKGKNIYPILYRDCPKGFMSHFSGETDKLNPKLNDESKCIGDYQYKDFTKLRNCERTSTQVLEFLDEVCSQIA